MTYYAIGRWIVEEQQHGEHRAGYGKKVIQTLSDRLNAEFGKGFSVDILENTRKFYLCYQDRISETMFRKFTEEKSGRTQVLRNWGHRICVEPANAAAAI